MALVYCRGSVASLIRGANNYSTSASTGAHGLDEKGESGEDYEMRQHVVYSGLLPYDFMPFPCG